jgi:hypothetical protein
VERGGGRAPSVVSLRAAPQPLRGTPGRRDEGSAVEVLVDDETGEPDDLAHSRLVLTGLFVDLDLAPDDPLVAGVALEELAEMVGGAVVEAILEEDIDLAHPTLDLIGRERRIGLNRRSGQALERERFAGAGVVGVERDNASQDPLFVLAVAIFTVAGGELAQDSDGAPLFAHGDKRLDEEFERLCIVRITL